MEFNNRFDEKTAPPLPYAAFQQDPLYPSLAAQPPPPASYKPPFLVQDYQQAPPPVYQQQYNGVPAPGYAYIAPGYGQMAPGPGCYPPPPCHQVIPAVSCHTISSCHPPPCHSTLVVGRTCGVNHCLHCIISIFFFPWLFVWMVLCCIYGC